MYDPKNPPLDYLQQIPFEEPATPEERARLEECVKAIKAACAKFGVKVSVITATHPDVVAQPLPMSFPGRAQRTLYLHIVKPRMGGGRVSDGG